MVKENLICDLLSAFLLIACFDLMMNACTQVTIKCARVKNLPLQDRVPVSREMMTRIGVQVLEFAHPAQSASSEGGNLCVRLVPGKPTIASPKLLPGLYLHLFHCQINSYRARI
jgi:hypothetical protein